MNSNQIVEIISFGDQVFETAVVDSIVIIFQKIQNSVESIQARCKVLGAKITDTDQRKIPLSYFELSPTSQFDLNYTPEKYALLKKITNNSIFLEDISETRDGIIQSKIGEQLFIYSQKNEQCKKLLFGMDVNFYSISYRNRWVDYRPSEMGALEQIKGGSGLRLRNKAIFERKKFSRARPQIASSVLLMNLTIFTMEIHFMVLPLLIGITIQDIFWPFSIAKSQHGSIVQILTKVGKYLLRLKSNYYGKFLFQERMIRVSNI